MSARGGNRSGKFNILRQSGGGQEGLSALLANNVHGSSVLVFFLLVRLCYARGMKQGRKEGGPSDINIPSSTAKRPLEQQPLRYGHASAQPWLPVR